MQKTVFVLGELNVDVIMTGSDVTPEWNREKLVDSFDIVLGSSSAITACGLAGLGVDVRFVSVVGDDEFGAFCIARLKEKGVNTDHVLTLNGERTGATLSLSTRVDRALLTYMGTISRLSPEHIPVEVLEQAAHIHFGSFYLQEQMRPYWPDLYKQAKERGTQTSFDTGWDPHGRWLREDIERLLPYTDFFIPSEDEFMAIYGSESVDAAIAKLPSSACGHVAVKCGARGAVVFSPEKDITRVGAFPVQPIDTTGAGDSFNAGLIYASLAGYDLSEAVRFACACGALATTRVGGASSVPSLQEVKALAGV